jgi:acyl-CoA synthetase (AMP-forming)/AMP-acid ligase II
MHLSYVHGLATTPLIADTIGGALNRAAERWGNRDALVACDQQLRYCRRELRDEAERAARTFIALGVQRGDRVGVWSGNCASGSSHNTPRPKLARSSSTSIQPIASAGWNMRWPIPA